MRGPLFLGPRRKHCGAACVRQHGFSMIEILVTLMIVTVGLLGLAGLKARAHISELESYQRAQALIMVADMVERVRLNRINAACFAITTAASGAPWYGTNSAGFSTCSGGTTAQNTLALQGKTDWNNVLNGASETKTTGGAVTNVGAMIGARGCVTYDASVEITNAASGAPMSGTGVYTVSVAWQGMADTVANNTYKCGTGNYGTETKRRVVATQFRIANLQLN